MWLIAYRWGITLSLYMLKIAINGYGRIGRNVLRAWVERGCPQALAICGN
jgi:lactate dehydrogenase-like 2-hydroxyacid dehydrogenase